MMNETLAVFAVLDRVTGCIKIGQWNTSVYYDPNYVSKRNWLSVTCHGASYCVKCNTRSDFVINRFTIVICSCLTGNTVIVNKRVYVTGHLIIQKTSIRPQMAVILCVCYQC